MFFLQLTSLITAFVVHINSYIDDAAVLDQMCTVGVILEMEGLLSCHSDEVAMLEDMMVAVDDLSTVTFKLVLETPQKHSIELISKR